MEILMAVFTGIVAVSLLVQSLALWGIYRSIRNISSRMDVLSKEIQQSTKNISVKMDGLLETVGDLAKGFRGMQENLTAAAAVVHRRVVELDAFLEETTDAARKQISRLQDTVDNTTRVVEETFDQLHDRVLAPINEISAILTGIKVGLQVLTRRRSRPVNPSRQDEEMFI
jgi:methyl-accepting chemotaxis protein